MLKMLALRPRSKRKKSKRERGGETGGKKRDRRGKEEGARQEGKRRKEEGGNKGDQPIAILFKAIQIIALK